MVIEPGSLEINTLNSRPWRLHRLMNTISIEYSCTLSGSLKIAVEVENSRRGFLLEKDAGQI